MKTNRILILNLIAGCVLAFTEVKAEDCVYSIGSEWWSRGTFHGLSLHSDCYTNSSHDTKVSSGISNLYLSKDESWSCDPTTGNLVNANDSSINYTLDTMPKSQESFTTYENGQKNRRSTTSYDENGTKTNESMWSYENGQEKGYTSVYYYADGITKKIEGTGSYENGRQISYTDTYYFNDGTTVSGTLDWTKDNKGNYVTYSKEDFDFNGNITSLLAYKNDLDNNRIYDAELISRDGSQQLMEKNYTHENGVTIGIYTQYSDLNKNLLESFETAYECDNEGCNSQTITHKDGNNRILDIEEKVLKEILEKEERLELEIIGCDANKVQCIKAYRTATGVGLSEAKIAIEAIIKSDYSVLGNLSADQLESLKNAINSINNVTATVIGRTTNTKSNIDWITTNVLTYTYNNKGGYQVTNAQGEIVETYQPRDIKRIYTVSEATAAAKGNKNTFSIRYR